LILKDTDLKFAISANRQLVLLKDSEKVTSGDESSDLFQQTVQGQVVDAATGETLPGVNIVVEGTTIGTTTDIDGEYSINVPGPEALLVFSYIGYTTRQVTVGDQEVIDIELQIGVGRMDELVVVGYGTQRAETLTGSVASIGSRELAKSPAGNVGSSLQGLLPGLVSMQRTGEPGGDLSNILVRGQSTTGNNAPLVLVDGVPEPSWQRLNSDDIESISVLKDASAAIYGVQAANGVILITTKRGDIGRPVFTLTHDQGFVQPTRLPTDGQFCDVSRIF
jgi:TonB-dependent starch-binding outer membrane protein SusC